MTVTASQGRILAFDFGEKRIGVATGQSLTGTTQALTTLKAKAGQPDWSAVAALLGEWQPALLLVGLPLNMDGSEQTVTGAARRFGNRLHGRFGLPVEYFDERLSSVDVRERLFELGGYAKLQDQAIDGYAAELILQSYFESLATR